MTKLNEKQEDINTKIDNYYFKGMFADKMLIYEDQYIKIGCMRGVSKEWRMAQIKLFLANKSTNSQLFNISIAPYDPEVVIKNPADSSIPQIEAG